MQTQSLIVTLVDLLLNIDRSVVHILPPAGTKTSILSFLSRAAEAFIYHVLSWSEVVSRS